MKDHLVCSLGPSPLTTKLASQDLIEATSGAVLCSTHRNPNPKASDCVRASDHTYEGIVDVTSRVVVGAPVEKSPLQWSVPYNVVDAAGNHAATVWRDVVVEEVDIGDLEDKVRSEVMAEKEKEIQEAVRKAVASERAAKGDRPTKSRSTNAECPVCPNCKQCAGQVFDASKECVKYCEEKYPGTCDNTLATLTDFWAQFDGSNPLVNLMSFGCLMIFLRFIMTLWFNPGALVGLTNYDEVAVPVAAVTVPPPPHTPTTGMQTLNGNPSFSDPLVYSDGTSGFPRRTSVPIQGGLFSPPSSRRPQYPTNADDNYNYNHAPLSSSSTTTPSYRTNTNGDRMDIYADIISPSETGDYHGGRR